ncbi:uncharacterized protein LOC131332724 [Rhododendron vialii]|uniref:uncharacterized protein LOC131332724 n=1 Tax=Rhododendron vialii TaxID=182163 RepID=UPI00265DCAC9|nr:uncharacterized protein LOC131332724 [Rhododendron vialii]
MEQVSSIIQTNVVPKYKDPRCPTISITIGGTKIEKALLDLGASINLLPYSIYEQLGLGEMRPTSVTLQLADRSIRVPRGMVEDVLVQVDNFIYPVDFVVLDTCPLPTSQMSTSTPVILRRPFLATADAVIHCRNGLLNLTFGNMKMEVNVFNIGSQMGDDECIHDVNLIDSLVQEHVDTILYKDPLEVCLTAEEATFLDLPKVEYLYSLFDIEDVCGTDKDLPDTLKYAFLGPDETFPAVISSLLDEHQESQLLKVLKRRTKAIGWPIADIQGIDPSLCTQHIYLEDDVKPSRQPQCRLNPIMKEVVKAEVLKLLDVGIIYPITDSKWVSPIQVVPKKSGVTMVANADNELVPTRVTTCWRVCIDYRKLNSCTRKDHFPLPFIDQIQERVAGHAFYCFLDGYSGYNQIAVSLDFKKILLSLASMGRTFSRCMLGIFSDMVERIVEVFMDDFSVFGDSFEYCLLNLEKVLERCEEKNLVLNWEKCHFMVTQGIVLGHIVSKKGIKVDKAKINLIANLPMPKGVKDIRVCEEAFLKLKSSLTSPPIVQTPDWELPFELMCNANDYAVGAVLCPRKDKHPYVISYQDAKARLIRWILLLQEFNLTIKDKKGVENVVADHLSGLEFEDQIANLPIVDTFPDEQLFAVSSSPWCVPEEDQQGILQFCHSKECGGHFSHTKTIGKKLGAMTRRNMMPLTNILIVEVFDCWGIDFMGPFPVSYGFLYILFTVDYVSKWVEAIPTKTSNHKVVLEFLKENILSRCPSHAYHPQTNGQAELANREVKRILEKTVNPNHKDWSLRLTDALWAYRTTYQTVLGALPYRLVYGKACHLPVELEYKAYWAIKALNYRFPAAGAHRNLQLNELEEIRRDAYDNTNIYKSKVKDFHDKNIQRKIFDFSQKVLLPSKLWSRWVGLYIVQTIFPHGAIEVVNPTNGNVFKVNGQRLKPFLENFAHDEITEDLVAPVYVDDPLL